MLILDLLSPSTILFNEMKQWTVSEGEARWTQRKRQKNYPMFSRPMEHEAFLQEIEGQETAQGQARGRGYQLRIRRRYTTSACEGRLYERISGIQNMQTPFLNIGPYGHQCMKGRSKNGLFGERIIQLFRYEMV